MDQASAPNMTMVDCQVELERIPYLDRAGEGIKEKNDIKRKEEDRVLLEKRNKLLEGKEKADDKLGKQVKVNLLRDHQVETSYALMKAKALLAKKKRDPAYKRLPDEILFPKFKVMRKSEFERFCEKKLQKYRNDPKMQLLHQLHGGKYDSWEEAKKTENENESLIMKAWRASPCGDPWRINVCHFEGVPFMPYVLKVKRPKKSR